MHAIYACLIAVNDCLHWSLHMAMLRICKVNHSCDTESGDIHGIQNLAKVSSQFEIESLTYVGFVY